MGTIADKLQYLDGTKQAIREAIIEKGQPVSDTDTFRSYADKVRAIESGGGGASGKDDITFYDYDGTIVKSYSIEEFASVAELPTPPEHERLTFQSWNWSIEDIKAMNRAVDVGAVYATKSGKSEFDMTFTEVTGLDLTLRINNNVVGGLITIDWGDGTIEDATTTTTGLKTFIHSYAEVGDYTVSVDSTSSYSPYGSSSSPYNMFGVSPNYTCTAVRLGVRCTSIIGRAFQNCYSVLFILIPNGFTSIADYTFSTCRSLTYVIIPEGVIKIGISSYFSCYALSLVCIPKSVIEMTGSAFQDCYALNNIVLHDAIANMGGGATFQNCNSLTNIIIPNNTTIIGANYFNKCFSLLSIAFSNNITQIGASAVNSCYSLSLISVPEKLSLIASSAFANCNKISKFIFHSIIPPTLSNVSAFAGISDICIFEVPAESVELYKEATNWNQFANRIRPISTDSYWEDVEGKIHSFELENTPIDNFCTVANQSSTIIINGEEVVKSSITNISFGVSYKNITTIPSSFLRNCAKIKTIRLSFMEKINSIGVAFCLSTSSLISIYLATRTPPTLGSNSFGSDPLLESIFVPKEAVEDFKQSTNWNVYSDKIKSL